MLYTCKNLPTKQAIIAKKLDFSKQLIKQLKIEKRRFPNSEEICQLLNSSRFNQLQLSVLQLYLSRSQNAACVNDKIDNALVKFAQDKIQSSLSEISAEMKSMTSLNCQQYIAQSKLLYRSSLTGTWLAGLFDNELRDKFRRPWLDMQQGIAELQSLWIIQQQLEKLAEPPEKLVKWQDRKVEGLLLALNNTKAIAIAMPPYWLD